MKQKTFLSTSFLLAALCAPVAFAGDIEAGKTKFASICISCHGVNGEGIAPFPKLAGSDENDVIKKLKQYRSGEQIGAMTAVMAPMAAALSDADIENVAAYIATLK